MQKVEFAYLNPSGIHNAGRKLLPGNFWFLTSQLKEGEKLIGLYDRGVFQNAPWLHSVEEFLGFEGHVENGLLLSLGYFAVPQAEFEKLVVL
ncbi:hypothetical protein COX95_03160 [bacterium CG_4_10_14_0_2_um_filter_33_32]|nr:MAG: hypothetical protein AUJ93_01320 [bacterium CG2_30_33_46]PIR67305.1 MAG: hypothetical protein COU50_04025 [bacterium CG10_big_fil_rev_8_21_14_0_10_33_18]PIU76945.1 MAG: hypothetical protein COS74_01405 [bacterium CG06_land_8_20_14_3_00_33_50]PIW80751.1 MAG: hypothetical protein COZ97_04555 [bacterium CG_4_8_14_3_um_filter_33_28]PIY85484.1 MAG: hypothetical protein COY76_01915 [bacterium CG_4_10_14_0_8_um_filter_33_57]PIZ85735.1 MAG: hypothetical protein COX95_03160 [bacterium CG_4_10_1